jgi:hypothetical protein
MEHGLRRILFVVAWSIGVSMTPIGLAVSAPAGQPPSAPLGSLQGIATHPPYPGAAWRHGHPARPGPGARKGQAA